MKIFYSDSCDEKSWNHYIFEHPQATFYHDFRWKNVMESCFHHRTYYLICKNIHDEVSGILPLIHLKSFLFGSIICSMPFLNFGGICSSNDDATNALIAECKKLLYLSHANYIELRHHYNLQIGLPRREHKVSMVIDLENDPSKLWNQFKSKHRTNIRRAEKNNLTIQHGHADLLDDFYRLISIGWRNHGTPIYPYSFFAKIVDTFPDEIEIFVVYHEGQPIATAMNGLFQNTVEGMWTYTLREFARLQTNYYLYWKMIEKACLDGYSRYHLGRSTKDSGSISYKKKWKASPRQLYWDYILPVGKEIPHLSVDNPKYNTAIKFWKQLPLPVSQKLGPLFSKYIP